jgi:putative transposase
MEQKYFHVYNRGAHKAQIFNDKWDYKRFMCLPYLGNSAKGFKFINTDKNKLYAQDREELLVEILAYCLMPNHFHIILKETCPNSKSRFLQKLCVGYTNYYNTKYKHSGTILQGKYKSKEICDQSQLQIVINYVHINPYKLKDPSLSDDSRAKPEFIKKALKHCSRYEFSSLKDHMGAKRPETGILTISDFDISKSDMILPTPGGTSSPPHSSTTPQGSRPHP